MLIKDKHIRPFLLLSLFFIGLISACTDYQHPDFEPLLISAPNHKALAIYLNTDSVLQAAESIKPVRRRLDSLLTWADRMNTYDEKAALAYADAAYLLAVEHGHRFSQALARYYRALLKGRWNPLNESLNSAFADARISKKLLKPNDDFSWRFRIISLLGNLYLKQWNIEGVYLDSVIHYLDIQEKLLESPKLSNWQRAYFKGYYYKDRSSLEESNKNISQALSLLQASIKSFEQTENEILIGIAWRKLGIFYSDYLERDIEGYFQKGLYALKKGKTLFEKNGSQKLSAESIFYLSSLYYNHFYYSGNQESHRQSLENAHQCLDLNYSNNFMAYEIIGLNYDQILYGNQEEPQEWNAKGDTALIYYKKAIEEAKKQGALSFMELEVEYINVLCEHKRRLTGESCNSILGVSNYKDLLNRDYAYLVQSFRREIEEAEEKVLTFEIEKAEARYNGKYADVLYLGVAILVVLFLIFTVLILLVQKRRLLAQMQALRSQINPHFINNSLNAIESLIIQDQKKEASKYLVHFSRLTRKMLDSSRKHITSLKDEIETLRHFLALEQLRFRDKFTYTIQLQPGLNPEHIQFPAVFLQPYVENAILHGIKPLDTKGHIDISIYQIGKYLKIEIQDNGIGRKAAELIKQRSSRPKDRKSHALKINEERIRLFQNDRNTKVNLIDLVDENQVATGTLVEISIPIKKYKPK